MSGIRLKFWRSMLLLLCLLPACREQLYYSGPYPAGWPLAELKLPAGARKVQLQDLGHGRFEVSFEAPGNVMTVVDNAATSLLDSGWTTESSGEHEHTVGNYGRELLRPGDGSSAWLNSRAVPNPNHSGRVRSGTSYYNEYTYTLTLVTVQPASSPASP